MRRITYVQTNDEDDDTPVAPDPVEPSGFDPDARGKVVRGREEMDEPMKVDWSKTPRIVEASEQGESGRAEIVIVSRGTVAAIRSTQRTLNWVLCPFAFRPPAVKMAAFRAQLAAQFGVGLTTKDYADAARSAPGRTKLRSCYDAVWKTHNLHSMALYAGPATGPVDKRLNTAWHGKFVRRIVQPGWVSTGDYDLTVAKRRRALVRYYAGYADWVGQLALPHHGSDLSFDASIFTAFPDLSSAIAAVGTNGHGHPGAAVQKAVATAGTIGFVRVDEGPGTYYQVTGPVAR